MSFAGGGMYGHANPAEIEMLARQAREARESLDAARQRYATDDGVIPREHHELIEKLEAEWKHLHDRLHRARGGSSSS